MSTFHLCMLVLVVLLLAAGAFDAGRKWERGLRVRAASLLSALIVQSILAAFFVWFRSQ